ncbi:MAG: TIGR02147 family protein [Bdellovibrio sp.]
MTDKNIFDFTDYKAYLRFFFERPSSPYGARSQFAKAIEGQSSFVSQLLTGKAELSLDQAFRASQFLGHSLEEADYFNLLVQRHRSTDSNFIKYLNDKIDRIRKERTQLKNRLTTNREISLDAQAQYYSSWIYTAIHMMASLKPSRSVKEIAEALRLDLESVQEALHFLEKEELISQEAGHVAMGPTHIHLPADSVLIKSHHSNWRVKAMQTLDHPSPKNLHYSVVYSLSRKDAEIIKRKIVDLIQENLKTVAPSAEEVLFANTIDFFEIGKDLS